MMIDKKQLTVRLPQSTVDYLYTKAENENKSLNDIMTDITEEYMKWQEGDKVLQDIMIIREKVKKESGVHPSSTEDIQRLRNGER
ncbi:hypothetical protein EHS13_25925 [Paenibacillus psychroresistens]|uniref:CopG family transcriptional regulator n=1 Tax=Paenibacillus psychroresistens TaxID=1778678 RepID=A0A6B8RPZ4_9BACL|nr:hypothetical protein [Paenibacillus psychroresistens]QGQ98079.1 hypothetical protein EHS13_25925 [Paenibacillus psychroresistens]